MEKDDLLNIKSEKREIKKPLMYGAIGFLVFIIGVIIYAIYSNSTNKDNVVLPPQVNENSKKNSDFKEVPIEVSSDKLNEKLNMEKLIDDENNENKKQAQNSKENKEVKKTGSKPEQITKKPVKTEHKKQVEKVRGKYYIQVAALIRYKKPNKKFLNLIKKEGFDYKLYSTYIYKNNSKIPVTKILIGPFENEKVARKKLKIVKEKITQNAFIFKVK